ncbi:MSCRAMM family protein [Blastococcus litoris]|uniref:MSCRAMM family protein n=1 Tax=Blastococcus litoris TaxID=2171622 RepID=UPI000E308C78|nr:prealbumin-like fold domain-containing protein [Blastococcus litoris]
MKQWSRVARGLVPIAALLALTAGVLPAASAAPASVPSVGAVRHLDLDLDVKGALPLGMLPSGVGFTFTSATASGTCVTDLLSHCDVDWTDGRVSGSGTSHLDLPAGVYTITQDPARALPGVAPRTGPIATVDIGDHWVKAGRIKLWPKVDRLTVENQSLYRPAVTARVVDQAGNAVRGARFHLGGPGLPMAGSDVTNGNGYLTIRAPFNLPIYRPGAWTLTPVGLPDTYDGSAHTVEITDAGVGASALDLGTVRLAAAPPQTGTGTLRVQPAGDVPPGLDLSGATFSLAGGSTSATCVTDAAGVCAVEVVPAGGSSTLPGTGATRIALPAGTYSVEQTSAPTGLAVDADVEDLVLCTSAVAGRCAATVVADGRSLFHRSVSAGVSGDGAAVEGMELTLTGPGYRVQVAGGAAGGVTAPAATWPGYRSASVATDDEGVASWDGWFLPGTWTISATGAEEPLLVFPLGPPSDGAPAGLVIQLPATPVPSTPTTSAPPTSAAPTSAAPTSAAPSTATESSTAGTAGSGAGAAPAAGAPGTTAATGGRAGGASRAAGAPAPSAAASPTAGPSTAGRTTAPSSTRSPAAQDGPQVFVAAEEPRLETAGAAEPFNGGVVLGVGLLFVAVVVSGVMLVRRRVGRLG